MDWHVCRLAYVLVSTAHAQSDSRDEALFAYDTCKVMSAHLFDANVKILHRLSAFFTMEGIFGGQLSVW